MIIHFKTIQSGEELGTLKIIHTPRIFDDSKLKVVDGVTVIGLFDEGIFVPKEEENAYMAFKLSQNQ